MAVDTVKKRASVLGIVWPDANGIDQSDRQTILGIYGGVLAGPPTDLADGIVCVEITALIPAIAISVLEPAIAITARIPAIAIEEISCP